MPDPQESGPALDRAPIVTVIMPFLNAERHIAAAIDSVRAQTLDGWELLLVDDGSSDRSRSIAEARAGRDPDRIRVLQHAGGANRGIAASRNLAMRAARGRYVAFLDADDLYEPRRLEVHVRVLEADAGLGVVLSADRYWHDSPASGQAAVHDRGRVIRPAGPSGRRIEPPAFIAATLMTPAAPMTAICSVTFRRSAFDAIGGAPDEFRGLYEDQVLLCKLLLQYPVLALDEPLARYRQHPESVTRGNAPINCGPGSAAQQARSRFLTWLQDYLAAHPVDSPGLQAWLRAEIDGLGQRRLVPPSGAKGPLRRTFRRALLAVMPARAVLPLEHFADRLDARRVRRRVVRRIEVFESTASGLDRSIRAYWNRRVNDTRLSDDLPGTAGFYAGLDNYRLRKNAYLSRVLDFGGWAGRDVLEVGCGPGLDLVRFARAGARVTGVDISPTAVDLARGCCQAAGVAATLLEADGARLPFADASFDLVYCHGVLSFVRDPARVVAEAQRVLRPGGEAVLMVYNRRSWMNLILNIPGLPVGRGHADAPCFRTWSPRDFETLLAGFRDHRLVFERYAPSALAVGPARWLRPLGWHLLAFCRKSA
jgi:SAM-dependent methyltransferase